MGATVDEHVVTDAHGREDPRDGARGLNGAGQVDANLVLATEDDPPTAVDVDGAQPQWRGRPGCRQLGVEALASLGHGEQPTREDPPEHTRHLRGRDPKHRTAQDVRRSETALHELDG